MYKIKNSKILYMSEFIFDTVHKGNYGSGGTQKVLSPEMHAGEVPGE